MSGGPNFISAFSKRFECQPSDAWLRSRLACTINHESPRPDEPGILFRELQIDLETIYVPTVEGIRLARWIYDIAQGFVLHRYQSRTEYVDVCMTPAAELKHLSGLRHVTLDPELVPIYGIHGLPGAGKSALVRALSNRVLPQPSELNAEGNPAQRLKTLSVLHVPVNVNFSLLNWARGIKAWLTPGTTKTKKSLDELSPEIFKLLYRIGVGIILVDELQFASGRTSAMRAIGNLFALRNFGVPIVFFANSDFIEELEGAKAQVSGRIKDIQILMPLLRDDSTYAEILEAQLRTVPFGYDVDIKCFAHQLYDMTAGLPRGSGRLIELGARNSIPDRRKITFEDLLSAHKSPGFESIRQNVAILRALAPIDKKKYPELASNSAMYDPVAAYREQMQNDAIEDAAALALYGAYSALERERAHATELEILRQAGKIADNISALGESKRKRTSKKDLDVQLRGSYISKHLANFSATNDTQTKEDK